METEVVELPLWQRVQIWLEANRKPAMLGAGTVVALGLIIYGVQARQSAAANSASEELANVINGRMDLVGKETNAAVALEKIARDYPKYEAGERALLLAGAAWFEEGNYAKALTLFEQFVREHREGPLVGRAWLGIAACYDAEGNTKEAITAYTRIKDHYPTDPSAAQAKLALAGFDAAENKLESAKDLYEDVAKNNPYSSFYDAAVTRYQELILHHPELIQKPVAATNAPAPKIELPESVPQSAAPTTNAPAPVTSPPLVQTNAPAPKVEQAQPVAPPAGQSNAPAPKP